MAAEARSFLPLFGVASLLLQLAAIVHSRSGEGRYFCWAPNDVTAEYALQVVIGGETLDPEAVRTRYQRPWFEELRPVDGLDLVEFRSYQHAIDVIRQYELTYGRADHAQVVMKYRINGGAIEQWTWPE